MKRHKPQLAPSMTVAATCLVVIALILVGLGASHVHHRRETIRWSYQLGEALGELREAEELNRQLRLERSVLTDPERIRKLAEARGMRQPTAGQVRVVRSRIQVAERR